MEEMTECEKHLNNTAAVVFLQAPDYFDFVKTPMDFSTIRNKIHKFEYRKPGEILDDLRLIFKNCQAYNIDTAPEYQAGQRLSRFLEKRCRELKLNEFCQKPAASVSKKSPAKVTKSPRKAPESSPGTGKRSTRSRRS